MRVVGGLVLGCVLGRLRGRLFQEGRDACGGGERGFVEKRYDIEGFALKIRCYLDYNSIDEAVGVGVRKRWEVRWWEEVELTIRNMLDTQPCVGFGCIPKVKQKGDVRFVKGSKGCRRAGKCRRRSEAHLQGADFVLRHTDGYYQGLTRDTTSF